MNAGDVVKYNFPSSKDPNKKYVLAIVRAVSKTVIVLNCEDASILKVTANNFNNIEILHEIKTVKKKLVA